jgi:hypothetical protein
MKEKSPKKPIYMRSEWLVTLREAYVDLLNFCH